MVLKTVFLSFNNILFMLLFFLFVFNLTFYDLNILIIVENADKRSLTKILIIFIIKYFCVFLKIMCVLEQFLSLQNNFENLFTEKKIGAYFMYAL